MLRKFAFVALVPLLAASNPAPALTAKEKQETCKIGADSQQLEGAKRTQFMKRCMAKGNFEPPGRKVAKKPAPKKPKPPATMAPAAQPASSTAAPPKQ